MTDSHATRLAQLRLEIERTDRAIMQLIGERVALARAAGRVKREAGMSVVDEPQELEVLARVRDIAPAVDVPHEDLHALQAHIIAISRRAQTAAM